MAIPKKLHFIFLGGDQSTNSIGHYGGKPFAFVQYMAVRSALEVNPGFQAFMYHSCDLYGPYWDCIRDEVECVRVDEPSHVFDRPIRHLAHKADVLRLQILMKEGGIYLDLDTICQKPFNALLRYEMVMGYQREQEGPENGLCNAVILAEPAAEFLSLWYDRYRTFSNEKWAEYSVTQPFILSKQRRELIHIEPVESFFWPTWGKKGVELLLERDESFPEAYLLHLWGKNSWSLIEALNPDIVRSVDTTYNRIARRFVSRDFP